MTGRFKFKVGDLLRPMSAGRYSMIETTYMVVKKFTEIDGQLYYEILEGEHGIERWTRLHAEFNLEKL